MVERPDDGSLDGSPSGPEANPAPPRISIAEAYARDFHPDVLDALQRAPCGCYRTEVDQRHEALDAEQRGRWPRVLRFLEDLRRIPRGRREPRLPVVLPIGDLTEQQTRQRWRYFMWLYDRDPKGFPLHIQLYARAHEDQWHLPPCKRRIMLLHPGDDVKDLPLPTNEELAPRRGGGPRPSADIHRRNSRIEALFKSGTFTHGIAKILDGEGYPIPKPWAKLLPEAERTFLGALLNPETKRRAEQFFSKRHRAARDGA